MHLVSYIKWGDWPRYHAKLDMKQWAKRPKLLCLFYHFPSLISTLLSTQSKSDEDTHRKRERERSCGAIKPKTITFYRIFQSDNVAAVSADAYSTCSAHDLLSIYYWLFFLVLAIWKMCATNRHKGTCSLNTHHTHNANGINMSAVDTSICAARLRHVNREAPYGDNQILIHAVNWNNVIRRANNKIMHLWNLVKYLHWTWHGPWASLVDKKFINK